jgi:hypothetical protein
MQPETCWKAFFLKWPKDLPRRGILVTVLNDQHPFKAFMTTDEMVLLERQNPDPLGSRILMLEFNQIALVKLTDVIQQSIFKKMGFVGKLSGK